MESQFLHSPASARFCFGPIGLPLTYAKDKFVAIWQFFNPIEQLKR